MTDTPEPVGERAWVCIVTPTVQDGQVARWYGSERAALNHHETVSASRNKVCIHGADLPTGDSILELIVLLNVADAARVRLARGGDVRDLATHRRDGFDALVPIETAVR